MRSVPVKSQGKRSAEDWCSAEQFAVMRQQDGTPERDTRRCFGNGIHRPLLWASHTKHWLFADVLLDKSPHGAHRISGFTQFRPLYERPCGIGCGHPQKSDHLQLDFLNSRTSSGGPPSPLNPNHNCAGQIRKCATHRDHDGAVVRAGDGLRQCGSL